MSSPDPNAQELAVCDKCGCFIKEDDEPKWLDSGDTGPLCDDCFQMIVSREE